MSSTRIAPVAPPYSPALAERFARLVPPGMTPPAIFRAVARNVSGASDPVQAAFKVKSK